MKPDWKSLVSQKNREMPEARRKIQKEHTKYQHKLDKLVNKLEKQLFKEVRRQRAGTQEIYDMFEILPRNPAFGMFSPLMAIVGVMMFGR